jgi:hypothetical protein
MSAGLLKGPDNPFQEGTIEYLAYDQVLKGNFPNLEQAVVKLKGVRPDLPSDPNTAEIRAGITLKGSEGTSGQAYKDNLPPGYTVDAQGNTHPPASGSAPLPTNDPRGMGPRPGQTSTAPQFGPAGGSSSPPAGAGGAPARQKGPPGYWQAPDVESDERGAMLRPNTNAPGMQSSGSDDPWLIGASAGMTYDPQEMERIYKRARAGDGAAAYILRQVGFFDEQNNLIHKGVEGGASGLEEWAASRQLDRKAAAGSPSPWYHDPKAWGEDYGFGNESDAIEAYKQAPWKQIHREGESDPFSSWKPKAAGGVPAGGNTPGVQPGGNPPTSPPGPTGTPPKGNQPGVGTYGPPAGLPPASGAGEPSKFGDPSMLGPLFAGQPKPPAPEPEGEWIESDMEPRMMNMRAGGGDAGQINGGPQGPALDLPQTRPQLPQSGPQPTQNWGQVPKKVEQPWFENVRDWYR